MSPTLPLSTYVMISWVQGGEKEGSRRGEGGEKEGKRRGGRREVEFHEGCRKYKERNRTIPL